MGAKKIKQKSEALEVTDNEVRDITEALVKREPLDDKYRFLLFKNKRQVELDWYGKNQDICQTVLPFQTIEHIDEPRKCMASYGTIKAIEAKKPIGAKKKEGISFEIIKAVFP